MIRRSSVAVPLLLWLFGTYATFAVVMAFTPIPPTSTTSFYTTQQSHSTWSSIDAPSMNQQQQQPPPHVSSSSSSSTSLDGTATSMMTPWNMNPEFGAPPFGFDMNAEIWNGRIAQVGKYVLYNLW